MFFSSTQIKYSIDSSATNDTIFLSLSSFSPHFEHNSYKWTHWQMNRSKWYLRWKNIFVSQCIYIYSNIAVYSNFKHQNVWTCTFAVYFFCHFMALKLIWIYINFRWHIFLCFFNTNLFFVCEAVEHIKPNRQPLSKRCNASGVTK